MSMKSPPMSPGRRTAQENFRRQQSTSSTILLCTSNIGVFEKIASQQGYMVPGVMLRRVTFELGKRLHSARKYARDLCDGRCLSIFQSFFERFQRVYNKKECVTATKRRGHLPLSIVEPEACQVFQDFQGCRRQPKHTDERWRRHIFAEIR